jgi:hypothetical protein
LKKPLAILILFATHYSSLITHCQEPPPSAEQQLESQLDVDQRDIEDDSYLVQLEYLKKHPLNLNVATDEDLRQFIFLTDLQIDNLVSYRKLLGKFISIYELQAVPRWDVSTIKKILRYVTISNAVTTTEEIKNRFVNGEHQFLIRCSQILEASKGFGKPASGSRYLGSKEAIFFRYRYQYKNLLQFGFVGDKDAGEPFFYGSQKYGFDFYSFHLFARKIGRIQSLTVGDFTVNMGQGLIQWQSLAFKKGSDVMGIKRQSSVLHPYNSAGEIYFHRGIGMTMGFGRMEVTAYASLRKLTGNLGTDTIDNKKFISSFLNSGYHRTQTENDNRNNVRQMSFGGNVSYKGKNWHIGANGVMYKFLFPIQKRKDPYNLFAIDGKSWSNLSVDYSYSHRNLHFFGEAATDKNFHHAFVNGLLISVDPRVDISILHRGISRAYQAVYGNAFTENTYPTNETGLYAGISIRPPIAGLHIDLYADLYKFSWLKYLVDAPSFGKDFLMQLTYTPNKQVEIFSRIRTETKQSNQGGNSNVTNYLTSHVKQDWRTQLDMKISKTIMLHNRMEVLWYHQPGSSINNGFLVFLDMLYSPSLKPFSANIRLEYFETDDYASRIYVYQNEVLYRFTIPAFFDKGYHYYINYSFHLRKGISLWMHLGQIMFLNKTTVGSGLDEIDSRHRTEATLQCQWRF